MFKPIVRNTVIAGAFGLVGYYNQSLYYKKQQLLQELKLEQDVYSITDLKEELKKQEFQKSFFYQHQPIESSTSGNQNSDDDAETLLGEEEEKHAATSTTTASLDDSGSCLAADKLAAKKAKQRMYKVVGNLAMTSSVQPLKPIYASSSSSNSDNQSKEKEAQSSLLSRGLAMYQLKITNTFTVQRRTTNAKGESTTTSETSTETLCNLRASAPLFIVQEQLADDSQRINNGSESSSNSTSGLGQFQQAKPEDTLQFMSIPRDESLLPAFKTIYSQRLYNRHKLDMPTSKDAIIDQITQNHEATKTQTRIISAEGPKSPSLHGGSDRIDIEE